MLVAVAPEGLEKVIEAVESAGVKASVVGRFGGEERLLIREGGRSEPVDETVVDELWRLLGERGQRPKRR